MKVSEERLAAFFERMAARSDPHETAPDPLIPTEHHIWCNIGTGPVESCRQCPGLWKRYPYDDEAKARGGGLMVKHFPQNILRR